MESVDVHSVSLVAPAISTKHLCQRKFLSDFDLMQHNELYNKGINFYHVKEELSFDLLVSSLKESLSNVLVDYYVLAGRLEKADDGRLTVNCKDQGIIFRAARTTARMDDWRNLANWSIQNKLTTPDHGVKDYERDPLCQLQVTQFACGGIAIGIALPEIVADGFSNINFLKSWSEVHRGLPISTPPVFASHLLKARNPPDVIVPVRDYVISDTDVGGDLDSFDGSDYRRRSFLIPSDKMEALISEIQAGPYSYGHVTSFEAMSALMWKYMAEAKNLKDHVTTKYVYTMSLRGKMFSLPPNYFGNAVYVPCLPANAGEIKARHMSYAAKLIHDDIASISTETVKSTIDWMEIQRNKGLDVDNNYDVYHRSGTDVYCTSTYTFPMYGIDFGWGGPAQHSLVVPPWYGELVYMLPTTEGGRSRLLFVQMHSANMERLVSSSFMKYVVEA